MFLYRQSIILFGMVLPIIFAVLFSFLCYYAKSAVISSYQSKQANFKTSEQSRLASKEIEIQVVSQREHAARWEEQLTLETASSVATNLKSVIEKLPGKEIQQTAYEKPSGPGKISSMTAQHSSQIRIGFRGTFRTLQHAFLELETRMPQLQMQEFRMEPSPNQASMLNVQVTFNSWEK